MAKTLKEDPINPSDFLNFLSSLGVSPETLGASNPVNSEDKPEKPKGKEKPKSKGKEGTIEPMSMINELLLQSVQQTPGKGMDDDVPATIDEQQPALLSEGEFVFPADIVSLLGDGNTEAGSKVLQTLMEQIRQLKTGQKEQPKEMATLLSKKV